MIRIAVVGAGRWGPNLIGSFHNRQDSLVTWVVDRDPERLEQVHRRLPEVGTAPDLGPVLAAPDVDAVVVATPTSSHYELARAALEAGKHVLVEKPLTDRVATAEELTRLAARAQRILMVGHVFVYNAAARWVKRFLDRGELGRVYYVSMVRTNLGPIRFDVNSAWDLASHDIALANWWLEAEPLAVTAVGGAWINSGIEDAVFATLRYPNQLLVHLHASWLNPRKSRHITLVGEKHMLTFDDTNLTEPVRVYDKQVAEDRTLSEFVDSFASFRMSVREGNITIPRIEMVEPLRTQCEHFLACIRSGRTPLTGGPEGLAVVRALEAIARSMGHGGREEPVAP